MTTSQTVVANIVLGALGTILLATMYVVWFYNTPAIASLETSRDTLIEDVKYIRNRVDDINNKLSAKK